MTNGSLISATTKLGLDSLLRKIDALLPARPKALAGVRSTP